MDEFLNAAILKTYSHFIAARNDVDQFAATGRAMAAQRCRLGITGLLRRPRWRRRRLSTNI